MVPKKVSSQITDTKKGSQSDTFNGGFMHVIHMLYVSVQKHLEQTLVSRGEITFSQFLILAGFSCEDKAAPVTQARLAEHLLLTEATVSRHITSLVKKKILMKEKDIYNKKIYNISLTKEGKIILERTKEIITKELDKTFKHISQKDKDSITSNFIQSITLLTIKK